MKIAAIYARVSSDKQKEEQTIASQVAALEDYAQINGYAVPREWIFKDEGYSGSLLVRPALERLRDLAAEGQIQTILILSPDRLSRRYAYQILLTEEFSRHGVETVFAKSPQATTPEEQLLLQFQGMIAEYERALIAERIRRGKKYRAKQGLINVLGQAPYGYRYIRKTDASSAYYQVFEEEARVAREVYRLYTQEHWSIGRVSRWLTAQGILTRMGKPRWESKGVWHILSNPAYKGTACYGKTESIERKRLRRVWKKGATSPHVMTQQNRPREEWIPIIVPAIVSESTYALAQERLEKNKQLSARNTKVYTLLQGLLVCKACGYAYYLSSAPIDNSGKRRYYRCTGSDNFRFPNGRICPSRPIRQEYIDEIVWQYVVQMLQDPALVQAEITRRLCEAQNTSPAQNRREEIQRDITRTQKGMDRLLDAYQETLLPLEELRKRMPDLRKRMTALKSEFHYLETKTLDQERGRQLVGDLQTFLKRLRRSAETLDVLERQRIMRLVVKVVLLDADTLTIQHVIPLPGSSGIQNTPNYLLRGRDSGDRPKHRGQDGRAQDRNHRQHHRGGP